MMFLLLLLFIVLPLVDLTLLFRIGKEIGFAPTLALVLFTGMTGWWIFRLELRRLREKLAQKISSGQVPQDEMLDGLLLLIGAGMLLAPGFLTDIIGLLLLTPPTRFLVRKLLLVLGREKLRVSTQGRFADFIFTSGGPRRQPPPFDTGQRRAPGGEIETEFQVKD